MGARRNAAVSWVWRESGFAPKGQRFNDQVLREAAEDNLVNKCRLNERHCEVPGVPRSTFLMVFSPDGTKVASTHGNHNIYVSELSTGKHVKTLSGHPRTPWCIAFHPSHTQLLASGCLGGQVRVWDLSGGSEVWTIGPENGIASIAFHPRDQLLVIAACNELYFWDWNQPKPLISVQTNVSKAKVRFVAFDALGHKLITGISCWPYTVQSAPLFHPVPQPPPENPSPSVSGNSPHEQIVSSYHHLVQRYDSLVRNYHHLMLGRYQPANTTDRGTDPMEVDYHRASTANASNNTEEASSSSHNTVSPVITVTPISHSVFNTNDTSSDYSDAIPEAVTPIISCTINPNRSTREQPESDPVPSTSQSAFQPVNETRGNRCPSSSAARVNPNLARPSSTARLNLTHAPQQAIRVVLTASLSRLQGFMENSIDQILNLWERYDAAYSSTVYAMNLLRDFPINNTPSNINEIITANSDIVGNTETPVRQIPEGCPSGSCVHQDRPCTAPARPASDPIRPGPDPVRPPVREETPQSDVDVERFNIIHNILRDSGNRLFSLIAGMSTTQDANQSARGQLEQSTRITRSMTRSLTPTIHILNVGEPMEEDPANNPLPQDVDEHNRPNIEQIIDLESDSSSETELGIDSGLPSNSGNANLSSTSSNVPDIETPSTSNYRNSDESNNTSFSDSTPNVNRSNNAFERVTLGVRLIERHTEMLISVWSRRQSTLRRVRIMWENLRREIICLQHSTDQETPSHYNISALARCRLLDELQRATSSNSTNGTPNTNARPSQGRSGNAEYDILPVSSTLTGTLNTAISTLYNIQSFRNTTSPTDNLLGNGTQGGRLPSAPNENRTEPSRGDLYRDRSTSTSTSRRNRGRTASSRLRSVRLQEIGHRRNVMNIRRGELELTRDRIRMHARRVLAIMFSIMMDCLEADQLSNRIIAMLRSLKKALSLTSLLLVSHLFSDISAASSEGDLNHNLQVRSDPPTTSSGSASESLTDRNFLSSIRQLRDEMYLHIRRSRTLLRLHPVPRMRRRIPISSRSLTSVLANSARMTNDLPPSTSGTQQTETPPNSNPTPNPQAEPPPSTSTSESTTASARTRNSTGFPRSNFFRRFFLNDRLMGTMVHVFSQQNARTQNSYVSNAAPPTNNPRTERDRQREQEDFERALDSLNRMSVPLVRINDVPISDMPQNNENPQNPHPRASDYFLPVINGQLQPSGLPVDEGDNRWSTTFRFVTECPSSPIHRIQVWDFTNGELPDISNANKNIVVRRCKIHNDASIDISQDGRFLVALLPAHRLGNVTNLLGIFSLEWRNLGECLFTSILEQNAVSVSLSPCARHLAVGLGSRRVSLSPIGRNGVMAVIYKLGKIKVKENMTCLESLVPIRNLEQSWESGFTSLNCLRWAPQPGQGFVYANNTGQLKILS